MRRAAVFLALASALAGAAFAQNGPQGQNSSPDLWGMDSRHKAVVDRATGIYKDGKTAAGLNGGIRPEEQAEILSTMFEGQSADIRKIITPQTSPAGAAAASEPQAAGYLDRLSLSHLTGYSPKIQALQSRLNAQAAGIPGTPRLAETGKLDYPTLSYPRYVLYYDLSRMKARLRAEKISEVGNFFADPAAQKQAAVLGRAESAIASFDQATQAAKNPRAITISLIRALSGKQKEASRWISEAALLQQKSRAERRQALFSPALYSLVLAAPVNDGVKRAYIARGKGFFSVLKEIADEDGRAAQLLESKSWEASLPLVAQIESRNAALNGSLSRYLPDYVKTPYLLDSVSKQNPAPGLWDKISAWIYPAGAPARNAAQQAAELGRLSSAFRDIAAGNLEAAHTILELVSSSGS
ncbi:MAG TPA: hypothetical protein VNH15_00900 [Elusimicrobiota bacterium]|nr:hypothetical protein [Elusimicrobiota bacterium]